MIVRLEKSARKFPALGGADVAVVVVGQQHPDIAVAAAESLADVPAAECFAWLVGHRPSIAVVHDLDHCVHTRHRGDPQVDDAVLARDVSSTTEIPDAGVGPARSPLFDVAVDDRIGISMGEALKGDIVVDGNGRSRCTCIIDHSVGLPREPFAVDNRGQSRKSVCRHAPRKDSSNKREHMTRWLRAAAATGHHDGEP